MIQKSVAFLYTNNELTREIKGKILFTKASKSIKYLGINLTKEVKKTVLWKPQDTKERNWRRQEKSTPCSWIRRINIINMSLLSKAIYRFNAIPVKCPNANGCFHRTKTNNPKLFIKPPKTPNSQRNLEKEEKSWRYCAPGLETILLQSNRNWNSMVLVEK